MNSLDHEKNGRPRSALYIFILLVAAALYLLQGLFFAVNKSSTFDESNHIAAGISAWHTFDFRIYPQNPPLARMIETGPVMLIFRPPLPRKDGWRNGRAITLINDIAAACPGRFHTLVVAVRLTTALLMAVFLVLLTLDVSRVAGMFAGTLCGLLFASQPILIAHGSLVTVDALAACFFYLADPGISLF